MRTWQLNNQEDILNNIDEETEEKKQVDLGDLPAADQPSTEECVGTGRQDDDEGEENNPDSAG